MPTIIRFSVSETKPSGTLAATADAGAFDLALVDVDRLEHRDNADGADEQGHQDQDPVQGTRCHQDAGQRLAERVGVGVADPAPGQEFISCFKCNVTSVSPRCKKAIDKNTAFDPDRIERRRN